MGKYTICLVGGQGVGKTSFAQAVTGQPFLDQCLSTNFIEYYFLSQNNEGSFIIMDIPGVKRNREAYYQWLQSADAILFFFELTDLYSKNEISSIIDQVKKRYPAVYGKALKILVGNKCDLLNKEEKVAQNNDLVGQHKDMTYFSISAKDRTNINDILGVIREHMEQCEKREKAFAASAERLSPTRVVKFQTLKRKNTGYVHYFFPTGTQCTYDFCETIAKGAAIGFMMGSVLGGGLSIAGIPWTGGLSLLVGVVVLGAASALLGAVIAMCVYIATSNGHHAKRHQW